MKARRIVVKLRTIKSIASITTMLLLSILAPETAGATASSMLGQHIRLFTLVCGYKDEDGGTDTYCSPPGTDLTILIDDGTKLTVSVDKLGSTHAALHAEGLAVMTANHVYVINKTTFIASRYVSRGLVAGILAVPFKFHISNKSTTAGSTIGGYVGYRTSINDWFAVTPIVAGGLALVSTQPAQAPSGSTSTPGATQTSSGFSVATGLIGSVGGSGSPSQFGVLIGIDWLGKTAGYQYEGKPWLAFEVGYNFAQ